MAKKKGAQQSELTPKQKRFCEEWVIDQNATAAAIRAGYSEKTAGSQGQRMLKKVEIQSHIQELQGDISERTQVKADDVVRELSNIAFANLGDYFSDFGTQTGFIGPNLDIEVQQPFAEIKGKRELTREQLACISQLSVSPTSSGNKLNLKLHDKLKALELLMRHLGMFNDKLEVTETQYVIEVPPECEDIETWAKEAKRVSSPSS